MSSKGKIVMNIALIFAGGVGQRMNSKTKPKQFLELHGKPIIIYTIEQFENHPDIDNIILACVKDWIPYLHKLIERNHLKKVIDVVPGGESGQHSIFNGLKSCKEHFSDDSIVLLHDGVRPLIDAETITHNIECVKKNGSAVTVSPAVETIAFKETDGCINSILERQKCLFARAPQSFILRDIFEAHMKAIGENKMSFVDSASLMSHYGYKLYTVEGPTENIKITTPTDFYIFRAVMDARENSQIFG